MKNIKTIGTHSIIDFVNNLWKTEDFKNYAKKDGSFLNLLAIKLSDYPIFFYDMSDPYLERNHLTALFRHIAYREYNNPYINDLYYLHELSHIATLNYDNSTSFHKWKEKISENELIASLISEAFIYFYIPTIREKTFNPLWADQFFKMELDKYHYDTSLHIPIHFKCDEKWLNNFKNNSIDLFSLSDQSYPFLFSIIINERRKLRTLQHSSSPAKSTIIKYNKIREKWLDTWEEHYLNLENMMVSFQTISKSDDELSINFLQKELKKYSNENYTPFYQVPLLNKKKSV